jgi:hypothetical protein
MLKMRFHSVLRHHQRFGNMFVRKPLREEFEHLTLALGQQHSDPSAAKLLRRVHESQHLFRMPQADDIARRQLLAVFDSLAVNERSVLATIVF